MNMYVFICAFIEYAGAIPPHTIGYHELRRGPCASTDGGRLPDKVWTKCGQNLDTLWKPAGGFDRRKSREIRPEIGPESGELPKVRRCGKKHVSVCTSGVAGED